jgi:hypothetical protein
VTRYMSRSTRKTRTTILPGVASVMNAIYAMGTQQRVHFLISSGFRFAGWPGIT